MASLVSEYLKFIQVNFNVSESNSFLDILNRLSKYVKEIGPIIKRGWAEEEANNLLNDLRKQEILIDEGAYANRFEALGNFGLEDVDNVYKIADDIIYDIKDALDWIVEYKKWVESVRKTDSAGTREQLIKIGQSILARAVDLAPMDTGYLKSSGLLVVKENSVVITFQAPYATYVHEDMSKTHTTGRAKFLEIAVQEFFPDRTVWVEETGYSGVYVELSIRPEYVNYKHYGEGA